MACAAVNVYTKTFLASKLHMQQIQFSFLTWFGVYVLLLSCDSCSCELLVSKGYKLDELYNDRSCMVEHIDLTFVAVSDIGCVHRCSIHHSVGMFHNPTTGLCTCCSGIYGTPAELSAEPGTQYYTVGPDLVCLVNYLVSGVQDNQLSESGHWCQQSNCNPEVTSARHARLNSNWAWTALPGSTVWEYVQVDFLQLRTIVAIALLGRDPPHQEYVTSFKVHISRDCEHYISIVDHSGAEKVFDGNSSPLTLVTRYLPERVVARCVRINPVTFAGPSMSLRFDVLGC